MLNRWGSSSISILEKIGKKYGPIYQHIHINISVEKCKLEEMNLSEINLLTNH